MFTDINSQDFRFPNQANDQECFNELHAVLKKHGKLNRFGMTLLHDHFEVAEDEILHETTSADGRTLTIEPIKKAMVKESDVATAYYFPEANDTTPKALLWCRWNEELNAHIVQ